MLLLQPYKRFMKSLTNLLSFIYPLTRKIDSKYNGKLELTTYMGKKVLDTTNTNYSYGSLQRIMRYSLNQINLNNINSVLILGMGGGSVIQTLREEKNFKGKITAVEIDPIIIQLAESEFGIKSNINTHIVQCDAALFITSSQEKFDLIIVDLFIDTIIPTKFLQMDFWKAIIDHSTNEIIFNTLCSPPTNLIELKEKFNRRGIRYEIHRHVEKTNKLLIAHPNWKKSA